MKGEYRVDRDSCSGLRLSFVFTYKRCIGKARGLQRWTTPRQSSSSNRGHRRSRTQAWRRHPNSDRAKAPEWIWMLTSFGDHLMQVFNSASYDLQSTPCFAARDTRQLLVTLPGIDILVTRAPEYCKLRSAVGRLGPTGLRNRTSATLSCSTRVRSILILEWLSMRSIGCWS